MSGWRSLAIRLVAAVVVATLVVLLDGLLGLRVEPTAALLVAAGLAVAGWAVREFGPAAEAPDWQQPSWESRSLYSETDVRTRRLASVMAHAQPGRNFDARRLARQLAELTTRRLEVAGRIPPSAVDPLGAAAPYLSPALLAYLRSAETDRPQVLTRKALHSHLKEIDSL